ncbi:MULTISPECIES: hypothetical protein [unclassified Guyparkeria]|uniref:hypothetical protein n=1 Tax=unclassified Guyparkeria TaxID=2626246 RepID=UPI0007338C0F|nr:MULTISPECIES: hypothetical protein [unclassified Guyparkeria]KTG16208.1 hypothetical protein AUR63_05065 [Guyparkeria sp. XI15]OAE85059.1 hypothetical protein AWR35_05075 [Guyparkeria sp. WRN-7]
MERTGIISERFPHVVDAVFHDERGAREAATALAAKAGLSDEQIDVVRPNDPQRAEKLEPESADIFRTILRSHVALGVIGVVVGLILAGILIGAGFDFAQARPGWVYGIFAVIGGLFGMMGAGVVSVRLDHERVIAETRDASTHGEWTVVAHADSEDEKHRASELLKEYSGKVSESL